MPPIPLHKNDPISPAAAKPDGITPSTAVPNPPPTRTVPAPVPATTTADPSSPPAPQPGARPVAPTSHPSRRTSSPPAPQPAGYSAVHLTTETRLAGPPPQYHIPPPSVSQAPGRSTTTGPGGLADGPRPAQLDTPQASPYQYEHRGGAVHDVPRSSLEGPPGYVQADNTPYAPMGGRDDRGVGEDGGIGGAAWNMLAKAGEALKKGEEAAWRAVRNN